MPWNWFCAHHPTYAADFEGTVALCAQRNVAVQTIKALARGPWAAGTDRNRETWYQPLEDEADIRAAVHWVLARPRLFLNSVGDVNLLPLDLQAADEVGPVHDDAAMAKLNVRTGLLHLWTLKPHRSAAGARSPLCSKNTLSRIARATHPTSS